MPSTPSHEETACPACKGPLKGTVIGPRGHSFCRAAPLPGWGPSPPARCCSVHRLRRRSPRSLTRPPVPLGPLEETCCEQHGEKIYFFCGIDAELLCVICREGPSHCTHPVAVLDGAVQPYRDRLRDQSQALRLEKKEMEDAQRREDRKLQELLTHIESERQQVAAGFGRLQQELADQHCLLPARLCELERQACIERDQYNSKLSAEMARLGARAQALEEQSQWPASVLLQDIRGNQSRCETKTFVSLETISPDLAKKTRDLHRKILSLPAMLRTFSENLACHLETDSGSVPLDPQAASRSLALAEGRKLARLPGDEQDLTHGPCAPRESRMRGAPPTAPNPPGRCSREPAGRWWACRARGRGLSADPPLSPLRLWAGPCPAAPCRRAPRLRRLLPRTLSCFAVWKTGSCLPERRRAAEAGAGDRGLLQHKGKAGEPTGFWKTEPNTTAIENFQSFRNSHLGESRTMPGLHCLMHRVSVFVFLFRRELGDASGASSCSSGGDPRPLLSDIMSCFSL